MASPFHYRLGGYIKPEPIEPDLQQVFENRVVTASPANILPMRSPFTCARLISDSAYPPGLASIHSYKIRCLAPETSDNEISEKENIQPRKRRKL
jgi:hypothetical protein